ncbi:hypothetical protein E1B28_011373 [Marasmius oreades]|uniref:VTT domain-containing protein n=1 Tax=Marasmius oreades TaxID=181124 RepID=A0A9P7UPW7_9AGAR|nr:uncharacterized protein E1B28_011373 [Marasmius oreades]KAG7089718.1 hypothetical protein E1B28_011373 [Marasmius oreades]
MTPPLPLTLNHANSSVYTLDTVHYDDHAPLITPQTPSYGVVVPRSPTRPSSRKLVFNATLKMLCIFLGSSLLLGGILWAALPTLEEEDRPLLRIPRSFDQLQQLNLLLKKYRDIYPYRIVISYIVTYLFLQAFSLPGSMYLSILGGAVWGIARALPLACCCVATGATLCYLLSAALGPALLTFPRWKARLDKWALKIQDNKENMMSFLIVLRIAPLPPHWMVNIIAPHVGIGIIPFWISTALGILGVTVIHTTIGSGLDEMTSADDFHLLSWKNFLGLSAIVVGVLIPVGLRYYFRREVADVGTVEADEELGEAVSGISDADPEVEDRILAVGPRAANKIKAASVPTTNTTYYEENDDDDDEDIILEAGPALQPDTAKDHDD